MGVYALGCLIGPAHKIGAVLLISFAEVCKGDPACII